jgi:hypothetical protein
MLYELRKTQRLHLAQARLVAALLQNLAIATVIGFIPIASHVEIIQPSSANHAHPVAIAQPMTRRTKRAFRLPPDLAVKLADYANRKPRPQAPIAAPALASYISPDAADRLGAAYARAARAHDPRHGADRSAHYHLQRGSGGLRAILTDQHSGAARHKRSSRPPSRAVNVTSDLSKRWAAASAASNSSLTRWFAPWRLRPRKSERAQQSSERPFRL